ncbi:MAG: hypothetical protein RR135_00250 [Oscillospiraceae bacterium]
MSELSFDPRASAAHRYPVEIWRFLLDSLMDDSEYVLRFSVVTLLDYYMDTTHIDKVLPTLASINSHAYYVKTAVAWALSVCYARLPIGTLACLCSDQLDAFIRDKALQKIMESRRVAVFDKQRLRILFSRPIE